MKLILSRKGFDSTEGRVASPIFPDLSMYSLPITVADGARVRYADISRGDRSAGTDIGSVVEQLTRGKIPRNALAHFDPDLSPGDLPRRPGWRGCFGQTSSAQTHLRANGVGIGDVFLFFGWFRRVLRGQKGEWRFDSAAPDQHVIFGWLQIGEILHVETLGGTQILQQRPWLADHPHLHFTQPRLCKGNAIYIAAERLTLPGIGETRLPGAGNLGTFSPSRVLTDPAARQRGRWKLPKWFAADEEHRRLTYHGDPGRWTKAPDCVLLDAAARGQEFVLDCADRPEAGPWIYGMMLPGATEKGVILSRAG